MECCKTCQKALKNWLSVVVIIIAMSSLHTWPIVPICLYDALHGQALEARSQLLALKALHISAGRFDSVDGPL